jgi:3-oxoacyl-[acyl-carrier protein] reductase
VIGCGVFSVDLRGQAAIVTGAGGGIGAAAALALARAGAAVVVNDINPDRAYKVAEAITAAGGRALDVDADVSNRFQAASVIERGRDAFGRIHLLVNAAGVYKSGDINKIDEWDWRRILDVNLTGAFFMSQLIARVMTDEGGGGIVNLAAAARTLPDGAAYIASKAGVEGLTRQCAREYAPLIRVNAVCAANITDNDLPLNDPPDNFLRQSASPDAAADVIVFLCSDAARFITGQTINVDGGTR